MPFITRGNCLGLFAGILFSSLLLAQPAPERTEDYLPTDYLGKDFHSGRREALRELLPDNSVMAVFAYPTRTYSNDVEYRYHPNPDLYYFSGYKEPHALLLIFKS
ncbi:MAG TPA: aminopeptidase P N-terminal domain-containing protein, partial [Chitinophagaceae bacterium]|nr:aminopeptidase P N-terminal domain-containing protein [Chitinophagaceae bacterium]